MITVQPPQLLQHKVYCRRVGPGFLFCYFKLKNIHSRSMMLRSRGVCVRSWEVIPSSLLSSAQLEEQLLTRALDRTMLPHPKT